LKKSEKLPHPRPAQDKSIAGRHAPMHRMVEELLTSIDPDGYREILAELRAEYQPSGHEVALVECLADVSWRIGACHAMETEILREGMRTCPGGENAPGAAAYAYMHDFQGPDLLGKLANYAERLQVEFRRCVHALERGEAGRRRASNAAAALTLEKLEPCTSVVQ
jgi:hypothetical protein